MAAPIHDFNREVGWWDDESATIVLWKFTLIQTEFAEAVEAIRRDAMDDKLPQYPGEVVENGDAAIRALDLCAYIERTFGAPLPLAVSQVSDSFDTNLRELFGKPVEPQELPFIYAANKAAVFDAMQSFVAGGFEAAQRKLFGIAVAAATASSHTHPDLDFIEVVNAKRAFNGTRADHKREARAAKGGKRI